MLFRETQNKLTKKVQEYIYFLSKGQKLQHVGNMYRVLPTRSGPLGGCWW
jgi:hypothetical protein